MDGGASNEKVGGKNRWYWSGHRQANASKVLTLYILARLAYRSLVAEDGSQRIHKLDDQKQGNDRKEAIHPIKLAGEQRHYEGMEGWKAEKGVSRKQGRKTSKTVVGAEP